MAVFQESRSKKWVVKIRDKSGRQIMITVNAKNMTRYGLPVPPTIDRVAAIQLEQQLISSVNPTARKRRNSLTISEVITRFLETRIVSEPQRYHYELVLKKYLLGFLGDIAIERVTPFDIERFKANLAIGRATASLRGYLIDTKTFFKWATKAGFIEKNPAECVRLPIRRRNPVNSLTIEQVKRLIDAVRGNYLEATIVGFLNLGVRRSELTRIEWADINFERNVVLVRGTKSNQAVRGVPISENFKKFLQSMPRNSTYVFTNSRGKKWKLSALATAMRRLRKRCNFDFNLTWQLLRKTYGSILVQSGKIPIEYVSKFLGHNDVRTTQDWYIGLRESDYRGKVSSVLNELI